MIANRSWVITQLVCNCRLDQAALDACSDDELLAHIDRAASRGIRIDGGAIGSRASRSDAGGPRHDDDLDRRVNEEVARRMAARRGDAAHGPVSAFDENDQELAELRRRFDAAPRLLEMYCLAEPWRVGQAAAMAAAREAVAARGRGW